MATLPALNSNGGGHICITHGSAALATIRQGGLTPGLDGNGKGDLSDLGILGEHLSGGNWHRTAKNLVI